MSNGPSGLCRHVWETTCRTCGTDLKDWPELGLSLSDKADSLVSEIGSPNAIEDNTTTPGAGSIPAPSSEAALSRDAVQSVGERDSGCRGPSSARPLRNVGTSQQVQTERNTHPTQQEKFEAAMRLNEQANQALLICRDALAATLAYLPTEENQTRIDVYNARRAIDAARSGLFAPSERAEHFEAAAVAIETCGAPSRWVKLLRDLKERS